MKPSLLLALAVCSILACAQPARAEAPAVRELRLEPATTSVPFGTAKLTVQPLVRSGKDKAGGDSLQADYQVEVRPLSFAGEQGGLTITITDETLRKLADGQAVEFSGRAVSTGGNNSAVNGTATPARDSKDTGAIRVRIEGKRGKLVFKTTYRLIR